MNREILFTGKSITSGEWIESMTIAKGTIKREKDDLFMEVGDNKWVGIHPHTLRQYSGINDKNKIKIFEGHLFKLGAEKEVFEARFAHGCFMAFCNGKQFGLIGELQICFINVIGNIYDNPELLQK